MRRHLDAVLEKYGTALLLCRNGKTVPVRGFLQPFASRSMQLTQRMASPLGEVSRGTYVYYGPAAVTVAAGDVLQLGEKRYAVQRAERIYDICGPLYYWGLCREESGEAV